MNMLNSNFDLISQMVQETFDNVEEQAKFDNILDFNINKNSSKKTKLKSEQLEFEFNTYMGIYDTDRSCYVFQVQNEVIELPRNWGPFKYIDPAEINNGEVFKVLRSDDDSFLEVLEDISGLSLQEVSCQFCNPIFKLILSEDILFDAPKSAAA